MARIPVEENERMITSICGAPLDPRSLLHDKKGGEILAVLIMGNNRMSGQHPMKPARIRPDVFQTIRMGKKRRSTKLLSEARMRDMRGVID